MQIYAPFWPDFCSEFALRDPDGPEFALCFPSNLATRLHHEQSGRESTVFTRFHVPYAHFADRTVRDAHFDTSAYPVVAVRGSPDGTSFLSGGVSPGKSRKQTH